MPTSLDPITEEELRPGDARGRLRTIRKLAAMYNAWLNPQIRHDTGKEDLQFSGSNVVLEYLQGGAGGGSGGTSSPSPFQLVQVAAGTNAFTLYPDSFLRADGTSFADTGITNSQNTFSLAPGDIGYLQFDTSDGATLSEASLVNNQSGPGNAAFTTSDYSSAQNGSDYRWDQSFTLLWQVFAADASGAATRGGIVYAIDKNTPASKIEIVQLTNANLILEGVIASGVSGLMAFPPSAPLIN